MDLRHQDWRENGGWPARCSAWRLSLTLSFAPWLSVRPQVQKDTESLLMIKTNREQLADVAAVIKEKHPYDNPEVSPSPLCWFVLHTAKTEKTQ